jgi:hypothetical protein
MPEMLKCLHIQLNVHPLPVWRESQIQEDNRCRITLHPRRLELTRAQESGRQDWLPAYVLMTLVNQVDHSQTPHF